jgi:hypothetical protein
MRTLASVLLLAASALAFSARSGNMGIDFGGQGGGSAQAPSFSVRAGSGAEGYSVQYRQLQSSSRSSVGLNNAAFTSIVARSGPLQQAIFMLSNLGVPGANMTVWNWLSNTTAALTDPITGE